MSGEDSEATRSALLSIRMLRAVVDGRTYESVAAEHGVTRTAVERRVKVLAIRLARETGIDGLTEGAANFIGRLRQRRDAVLDALRRFEPQHRQQDVSPRIVSADEVIQAAQRIRLRSPQWRRDVALFYVLFVTCARPLEIARLAVRDFLEADGSVRRRSELRSEVSIGCRSRPLFFSSKRLDEALAGYLAERLERGFGKGDDDRFRGLAPHSRLFLTADGKGFEIEGYGAANQQRYLCREILQGYRKIFRYAELKGVTALTVRHTVVARLYERGADEDQVGLVLGIADRSTVKALFPRPRPSMAQLVEDLLG